MVADPNLTLFYLINGFARRDYILDTIVNDIRF
jgi:hypothetical protein